MFGASQACRINPENYNLLIVGVLVRVIRITRDAFSCFAKKPEKTERRIEAQAGAAV